jgi:hypothetical protein
MHETVKPLDDVILKHQGTSWRVELWEHPEQALVIATEIPAWFNASVVTA